MKRLTVLCFIILSFIAFSQNEIGKNVQKLDAKHTNYNLYALFTNSKKSQNATVNKVVENATTATINPVVLQQIQTLQPEHILLQIPYNNTQIEVKLYKVNLFTDDFQIDTNIRTNISYKKGVYYRGIINNDYTSVASFNFFENGCNGILSGDVYSNVVIGKLDVKNNSSEYIIYEDHNFKVAPNLKCATKDDQSSVSSENDLANHKSTNTTRCVTMYFEIDYNIYLQNGSDTTNTTNWMTSVFNNVQTLYNNDTINIALKSMYIWTTQDPYEGAGTSSSDYLFLFNATRPVFNGDVGQLVGIDSGGLGGVAVTINGLCSTNNFSYSDVDISYNTVPTYSWTVQVITHEFGHLLGSPHTHACVWNGNNTAIDNCAPQALGSSWEGGSCMTSPPTLPTSTQKGTIMSYCHLLSSIGIKFSNGFGTQPKNRIISKVNAATCLSTDCVNTCINTVEDVSVGNITSSTAIINWIDSNSSSWQIAVYPKGQTATTWSNASTTSFNAAGLNPNTYYVASVRPLCSNTTAIPYARSFLFVTPGNFCGGLNFYDTGGVNNNYGDMETVTRIMIPNTPNNVIKITFTAFDFEQDYDYLYLYDGNSVSAPEIGSFTGTDLPGPYTSTAADGSMTLKYVTDQAVNNAGFEAFITCTPNLSNQNFSEYIDFVYYPNPVKNTITLHSSTKPFTTVTIYNITGQLLYTSTKNQLDSQIDLSSYASGTYFFKVDFGEKQVHFKIVKE